MKTSELIGATLDWAVAKCEGLDFNWETTCFRVPVWLPDSLTGEKEVIVNFCPSTDWAQGGPIIEREKIDTYTQYPHPGPTLWYGRNKGRIGGTGPTPLIAAMRCYVASKLGDDVDIPKELE